MMTYFEQDQIIVTAADQAGYDVVRRAVIEVADTKALPKAYTRTVPDYSKLRTHLELGVEIEGAALTTEVEYILRPRALQEARDAREERSASKLCAPPDAANTTLVDGQNFTNPSTAAPSLAAAALL